MSKKKILLISYHFPPGGGVGGRRAQRFAKWLPSLDWEPTVLSMSSYSDTDNGKQSSNGEIKIIRVRPWKTINDQLLRIKSQLDKRGSPDQMAGSREEPETKDANRSKAGNNRNGFLRMVDSYANLFERESGWVWPAILRARRVVRETRFDCILTSSPPHLTHLVGLGAMQVSPDSVWIADYRDPWLGRIDIPKPEGAWPSAINLARRIEVGLEKKVLKRADGALFVTANSEASTRSTYPRIDYVSHVLPNGIDSEVLGSMSDPSKKQENAKFIITYLGTLYLHRDPTTFLHGLKRFMDLHHLTSRHIEVRIIGFLGDFGSTPIGQTCEALGLKEVVKTVEKIPHSEAIEQMNQSDVLLLFAQFQPNQIPAKTYEYLWTRTPVLCLCEKEGATAALVRRLKGGITVEPKDVEGVVRALTVLYENFLKGSPGPAAKPEEMKRYDARYQTRELVDFIEYVANAKSSGKRYKEKARQVGTDLHPL